MLTNNEVTLLKDFIDWQSLPFKEDVIFTSYEQQIKAFEKWRLSGKTVADLKKEREINILKTLKTDAKQRNPRATYEMIAEALDAAIESLTNENKEND